MLNERAVIDELVTSLGDQLRDGGAADSGDEVLVVDGVSKDGTWKRLTELAETRPWLSLCQSPGGVSAQRNQAVVWAKNEWIAYVDAGCAPKPGWLEAFREAAAAQRYGLLTGFWEVEHDGRAWQHASALATYPEVGEVKQTDLLSKMYEQVFGLQHRADLPNGRSMAATKAAWQDAGGWPEDMVTAEDVTFGWHIVESGHRAVLVSDAVVAWEQRDSLRATWRMFYRYGQGDGQSGNPLLMARLSARAAAYGLGPVLFARGGLGRWIVVGGLAAYLSVPLRRARRDRVSPAVVAMIPLMMGMKDLGKAAGAFRGLAKARFGK